MSFGNDNNIFRALQQFIDENGDEFESIEDAVEAFMSFYHQDGMDDDGDYEMEMSPEMESTELLELSMSVTSEKERKKLLKKAIDLWPENWNAHLELIDGSYTEQIKKIRELEEVAFESWQESDQVGWLNYEERPYLSLKFMFSMLLFKQGLLIEALDHFEALYEIDEMDSLGARYYLMAIYCRIYDWESAYELYTNTPYPSSTDDRMIMPLLVLAIITGNMTYAKDLFLDLEEANDDLHILFSEVHWPVDLILSYAEVDQYQPNTFSSIALSLNDILPVVVSSEFVYEWMLEEYESSEPHERVNVNEKVISFKGATKHFQNQVTDSVGKYAGEISVLKGVVSNAYHTLVDMDLVTVEAFSAYTEKELLAIRYIGPKTIEQLKENGVQFKES